MNLLQQRFVPLVCAATLLLPALTTSASEPSATAPYPAFEAHSELFELVGRIKDSHLTLTLDRWASNEPVSGAQIEIDLAGRKLIAEAQADGTYTLDASALSTPATYPLTISIATGDESDLLAADLVVAAAATPRDSATGAGNSDIRNIGIAATTVLLVAAAATLLRRRRGESA